MKKEVIVLFLLGILLISPLVLAQEQFSEKFTEENIGPTAEEIQCLKECVSQGCEAGDDVCMMANSDKCMNECGVEPEPEPADEGEACMQECVSRGCDKFDSPCVQNNK